MGESAPCGCELIQGDESECGYQWGKLDLKVRTVTCINCGTVHDRDENAAKNINQVGMVHRPTQTADVEEKVRLLR